MGFTTIKIYKVHKSTASMDNGSSSDFVDTGIIYSGPSCARGVRVQNHITESRK